MEIIGELVRHLSIDRKKVDVPSRSGLTAQVVKGFRCEVGFPLSSTYGQTF